MISVSDFVARMKACLIPCSLIAICVMLLSCLPGPQASAQSIFANLSGTVTDTSGAVVPGAKVTVQDANSKTTRHLTTNSSGYFSFPELPAGTYNVIVEAKGFAKWVASGVTLQSTDDKRVDASLKVGAETETVEVSATAGEVAVVDSGEKSADLSAKEIQDLSLVGRNAIELLKVLPGFSLGTNSGMNKPAFSGQVVGINGFCSGNGCSAGGLGGNFMNGQSMNITQDGQNTIDPGAQGSATPVNVNPESISEVKVLTSNFSAENAQGPVVVNSVTKSGGSNLHGGLWFYARNSVMNANEAFYKEPTVNLPKPTESYYYPGARIGGPIPKTGKKAFFFEMFEAYRQNLDGGVDRSFIPTADMLNGDFSFLNSYVFTYNHDPGTYGIPTTPDPTKWLALGANGHANERPGCVITGAVMNSACIDPDQQILLKDLLPTTGFVDPTTHAGFNYEQAFNPAPQNSWQNVTREDVNFTENTKVFVTWSRQRESAFMPTGLWVGAADWYVPPPSATVGKNGSDSLTASFLKIFSPTLTSETTFGYTWINFPSSPTDPAKVMRSQVGYPLKGIFNNPDVPAILSWGGGISYMGDVGHEYHPTMIAVKAIPSIQENLTKVIKTHTTKYGFFYQHLYNKQDNWGQFMGVFQYTPIWWGGTSATGNQYADALMGINGSYYEQALPPPSNLSQNIAAFYAQDDWKLNRRITVQYGMRFEHYAKPYSPDNYGLAVFDPVLYSFQNYGPYQNPGVLWHGMDPSIPLSGTKSRFLFFSPRVGAAIDVFGNAKTVVRGGWGKYRAYDSVQSNNYTAPAQTALGSVSWGCGNNDPLCPTAEDIDSHAFTPVYGNPSLLGTGFSAVSPSDSEQPLITSYSLTVDQWLPAKFRVEMSYVGNHTDFQQDQPNLNAIPLGAMANAMTQYPADCTTVTGGVVTDNRATTACENHYRPFPNYQAISESLTAGKAQFDSFQASLRRSMGWLTLQANYTFEKVIGDNFPSGGPEPVVAMQNYGTDFFYGILPWDRAHNFSASYVFDIPGIRGGSKIVRGLTTGWQISGITTVESGQQMTANSTYNLGYSNTGGLPSIEYLGTPDVPLLAVYTCNPAKGLQKNQYMNPNCFAPPSASNPGTGRTPYMPGPFYWNTDLTLAKNIKIGEQQSVQLRFATFDPLNHSLTSFTSGDGNAKIAGFNASGQVTNATGSTSPCPGYACTNFGYADYALGHRVLELGVKYTF